MTTMNCVHASNLLNDAPFVNGEVYQCYRNDNKQVFVIDALGFHVQVELVAGLDGKAAWGVSDDKGEFHFTRNI